MSIPINLGGPARGRTEDRLLKRELLYQLSYRPNTPHASKASVPTTQTAGLRLLIILRSKHLASEASVAFLLHIAKTRKIK